jgi:hypothetical protein
MYTKPEILVLGDAARIIQGMKSTIQHKDPDKVELASSYEPEE